ncbi:hypothetical protein [Burkholderia orbicola]|uniref:hypothetical protein n=1 Tax=Burkholderia orbicola TaxID=2978683 RepID=UPI002FE10C5E
MDADISFKHTGLPQLCAFPIISHIPGVEMSTGMHGSGFFVRSGEHCFVVTSLHCIWKPGQSLADNVRNLLIPAPFRKHARGLKQRGLISTKNAGTHGRRKHTTNTDRSPRRDFWLTFSEVLTAKALERTDEFTQNGEFDIAVLPLTGLSSRASSAVLANAIKLPPAGTWFDSVVENNRTSEKIRLRARGFPLNGTESSIAYESATIIQQGVHLTGYVSGPGPFPHSITADFEQGSPVSDINGLSGGPVFLRLPIGRNNFNYFLVGVMTNGRTRACTFVTVQWVTDLVNSWVAEQAAMKVNGGNRTISIRHESKF